VGSTKSTMSFYYTEWSRLGGRMDQARVHIRNEELRIFSSLRQEVIKNLIQLRRNAAVMDELDVACSFASLAEEQALVRPILNIGLTHKIVGGRHPTVKLGLEETGRSFVSNDLFLGNKERIWLVTGPNMAGKSTFLRQNALISILAQVGSYVPAEHAEIGLVDQIFSRIGAADDLFRDQSTFMVEMLETAAILKHATPRSFVIMDEVGRGTTPEDGTAVGYACLHHLYHVNKCRTLFATHFHALADMTDDMEHLGRYCTDVLEEPSGAFSFVHRLRAGVNRRSHALKVARLAGLPEPALQVASAVLQQLLAEKHNIHDLAKEEPRLAAATG
jgi:DNA mismatch repair ATPase MutS